MKLLPGQIVNMRKLFTRIIAPDSVVARVGQAVCFGGACLVPVLVFHRFTEIDLSEAQLIIGVLATMSMALVFALLGMVLRPIPKSA